MKKRIHFFLLIIVAIWLPIYCCADEDSDKPPKKETILHEKPSQAPDTIEVNPQVGDKEIEHRLQDILRATGWFTDPKVEVKNGVVFLSGETKNHQFKDWAGDLAHNTQHVTAVVNKILVQEPSIWDLHMIATELLNQGRKILRSLPAIIFGALILVISWMLSHLVYKLVPLIFRHKMAPSLLHEVFARAISFCVFLLGVYFIFEMSDLTTMALTVISGTGLLGIIIGIAFRDITENFLASILLSIQNPFHAGDLIDITSPVTGYGVTGYVERLTLRVTILVSLEGNHLQIPNATVYKSNIRNYSSNPNRREDFIISIGINCSISKAVEAALRVVMEEKAILKDPEPLVLVDGLTKDLVNLHIYYWIDVRKHNWLKVKSSVIRLVKQAFQDEEIDFPSQTHPDKIPSKPKKEKQEASQTTSEEKTQGDSQTKEIKGLSSQSRHPEEGKNLLDPKQNKPPKKEDKESE